MKVYRKEVEMAGNVKKMQENMRRTGHGFWAMGSSG
jgi:hypothetical protein